MTNIGSTHVLGQHLNESTMTVINGVVKGTRTVRVCLSSLWKALWSHVCVVAITPNPPPP